MRARRLLTMGVGELAGRSRQEVSKWLERVGVTGESGEPQSILTALAPEHLPDAVNARLRSGDWKAVAPALLDHFRTLSVNRFFEGAGDPGTPRLVAERMPEFCERTMAAAESACRGRFDLLGYQELSFGNPVDWHLDPISGCRAPLRHWSQVNTLDPAAVGDSKVVWELNRHQWLVPLGQAYRLTHDERYANAFARYLAEWMAANPPGTGINWASSLEVALRMMAWSWALFLFRDSAALSPEFFARMLVGIGAHAAHVERYLSYYFSPNTHLTGEALGLFYAGILFPELRGARRWRERGARILLEEGEKQVLPDGVYFEQSTCYQRYTIEIHLQFLILAARNRLVLPASLRERVERMVDFLLAVRRPDGSMPQIGDADGGCLLPLAARAPDDFRGVFSTAAACFDRSDYGWASGGLAPETAWLLGGRALTSFEKLPPRPPTAPPSRIFRDGGYAVMRSGWDERAHQLIFDVGPLGCWVNGAHGHADLLSVQCSVFGEPYLVDAGTYCYMADAEWRDFFRSTRAHSSVIVDGAGQAVPDGPFAWRDRPSASLRHWVSTAAFDLADAEHAAYSGLADPVTHRRRVVFVKPRYWLVVDDLTGTGTHEVELRFQLAPLRVTVEPDLWARATGAGGHALLIRVFAPGTLKVGVVEGETTPIGGWVSPNYGERRPAPTLIYSLMTKFPLRLVTLLLPMEDSSAAPPVVAPLPGDRCGPAGLVFDSGEVARVDGNDVVLEQR